VEEDTGRNNYESLTVAYFTARPIELAGITLEANSQYFNGCRCKIFNWLYIEYME